MRFELVNNQDDTDSERMWCLSDEFTSEDKAPTNPNGALYGYSDGRAYRIKEEGGAVIAERIDGRMIVDEKGRLARSFKIQDILGS